jgi:hypothetical protein
MQQLSNHAPDGWEATNGERLVFVERRNNQFDKADMTPPTRGSWFVHLKLSGDDSSPACAGIEAYEQASGTTLVEFRDGYFPYSLRRDRDPIGAAFEEFCEMVFGEVLGKPGSQEGLAKEFIEILKMAPHPRGREFQKWFAKLVEQHGWLQEEGVRTSHEEMDVFISREREYYLAECKWEQRPVGVRVIRELFGKLGNRTDTKGIVVSMSGFSGTVAKQVQDFANQRVILLFGPVDVCLLLYGQVTFDDLVTKKCDALVKRRKAVYS